MSETTQVSPETRMPSRPMLTVGEAGVMMFLVLVAGVLLGAFVLPSLALGLILVTSVVYCVVVAMTIYLLVLAFIDARRAQS